MSVTDPYVRWKLVIPLESSEVTRLRNSAATQGRKLEEVAHDLLMRWTQVIEETRVVGG